MAFTDFGCAQLESAFATMFAGINMVIQVPLKILSLIDKLANMLQSDIIDGLEDLSLAIDIFDGIELDLSSMLDGLDKLIDCPWFSTSFRDTMVDLRNNLAANEDFINGPECLGFLDDMAVTFKMDAISQLQEIMQGLIFDNLDKLKEEYLAFLDKPELIPFYDVSDLSFKRMSINEIIAELEECQVCLMNACDATGGVLDEFADMKDKMRIGKDPIGDSPNISEEKMGYAESMGNQVDMVTERITSLWE